MLSALHLLVPEAQWRVDGDVVPLPPPSDDDVTAVLHRVLRLARKDFADVDVPFPADDFEGLQVRALQKPLPLNLRGGPRGDSPPPMASASTRTPPSTGMTDRDSRGSVATARAGRWS